MAMSVGVQDSWYRRLRRTLYHHLVFHRSVFGVIFVMPALLFFLAFSFYPAASGLYLSLTDYSLLKPARWLGLENYTNLLSDALFRQALGFTALFVVCTVLPRVVVSLLIATVFTASFRGREFFKAAYYTPALLSGVVISLVWKLLGDPAGLLNLAVAPLTGGKRLFWLADPVFSPVLIIGADSWAGVPFYMMVWLAGLVGIPREFYEAATIDGAGRVQAFLRITLPLLRPTGLFVLVVSCIHAFQAFTLQYVITDGGPNNHTTTVALLVYRYAFQFYRMGAAAAISVVMFAIIILLTFLQMRLVRSEETSYV